VGVYLAAALKLVKVSPVTADNFKRNGMISKLTDGGNFNEIYAFKCEIIDIICQLITNRNARIK
jgi:hypothetical protein